MNQPHRLQQIFDALIEMLDELKEPDTSVSGFPTYAPLVLRKYVHWSAIETQGRRLGQQVFPALLLNYGEGGRRIEGGSQAEYASLGETEDYLPFTLLGIVVENTYTPADIGDQVSDLVYSVERLVNGQHDLGIEGVVDVRIEEVPSASSGRATAIAGRPMDVVLFNLVVVHVYRSTNFA